MSLKLAKDLFYQKNYKEAQKLFENLDYKYEAGFCAFLSGDEIYAKNIWQRNNEPCLATSWGLIVLDLIKLKIKNRPTFFQVRAFLEVYLNLLIENGHLEWAENLISSCEILAQSNPETYKFIARVLFANKYYNLTHKFIDYSKNIFPLDPEALLIEAQTYFIEGEFEKAKESIIDTLSGAPQYHPALKFQKLIDEKIKNSQR